MRGRLGLLSGLLVLGLVAAACGSNGGGSNATTPPASTGGGQTTGGGQSSGGDNEAKVTMQNIAFNPTTVTVAQGGTIELDNMDSVTHTFTVEGQSLDKTINSGEDTSVTVDLSPGSYSFHCKIHPSMTGTLTVTG
jgi:plastocyanin